MPRHDEGFFSARDNLRLFWESDVPDSPRAHVGLVHGYADHCGRYRWVIDQLVAQGFAVHAFDYRGHGQSGGRRGHCDRFEDFVDDLELFWGRVRAAAGDTRSFLLGHSHGALMAVRFQARAPHGLSGLVLSSPLFELAFKPPWVKVLVSRAVGKVVPWLPVANPLQPADLTRDPGRQREVANDPLYNHVVTPRWFDEFLRTGPQALAQAPDIQVPTFVFCGPNDPVVSSPAIRRFFAALGAADKKLTEYPDRVHEAMNDVGREEVLADISGWISAHL